MSNVFLNINGKSYGGWKTAFVNQSLDQVAGSFGFEASNRFPNQDSEWDIYMGDKFEIKIDTNLLLKGYIDTIPESYSNQTHSIGFSGRDKTADLVDCVYDFGDKEFNDVTGLQIINKLVAPFGILLTVDSSVTSNLSQKITGFTANTADTVFTSINNLCKAIGVLPVSIGDGKLTLTSAGKEVTTDNLTTGINILTGSRDQSNTDRFSNYKILGQDSGTDLFSLDTFTSPVGEYEDKIITRFRPMVILSDTLTDSGKAKKQAEWEARRRAGESREYTYTVQGWLQKDGTPWELNKLIQVNDTKFNVTDKFLIAGLKFNLPPMTTTLLLRDPSAYALLSDSIGIKTTFDSKETTIFG